MISIFRSSLKCAVAGAAALMLGAVALIGCSGPSATANKLVILHTNDTHSQIEPTYKDAGGVMRRMAVIDSIRGIYDNVMLVDAGDVVQGTLYFYLYGGVVEQEVLNIMGLDEGILGNHEFDNGIDSLAAVLRLRDRKPISTNYIADGTPLDTLLVPWSVREYGGKKIGIIGINLDPKGIISDDNYRGLGFMPIVSTANATAAQLRQTQGVDAVIALTHIGYNPSKLVGDSALARNSRGIDIIIGGHSHDVIDPTTEAGAARSRMLNMDGQEVLVVQTGKSGRNLGKIEINLDSLGIGGRPQYELIPIDGRFDGKTDPRLEALLRRYKPGVDSLKRLWVGQAPEALPDTSVRLLNYFTDFIMARGRALAPHVDLAIANKGGLRRSLPQGLFSKGDIIEMLPFRNYVTIVDVRGNDLIDIFEVMSRTRGNGVSANVRAMYRQQGDSTVLANATVDGRQINPSRVYRVATIDYLAEGGDYMKGFCNGNVVAKSAEVVYDELLRYISATPDSAAVGAPEPRWIEAEVVECH